MQHEQNEQTTVNNVVTDEPQVITSADQLFEEPQGYVENFGVDAKSENDEVKEEETPFKPNLNICPGVEVTKSWYKPYNRKYLNRVPIVFTAKRLNGVSDEHWGSPKEQAKPENAEYINTWTQGVALQLAVSHKPNVGWFDRTLDNADSQWRQGFISGEGRDVYLDFNRVSDAKNKRRISGTAVKDIIDSRMGLGVGLRIPLPHTGPRISIGPRTTEDYLALDVQMALDKRDYGRSTIGLIYQNSHINIVERIADFIVESVRRYNRQDAENIDILSDIAVTDLPILQWGMACTIYPEGYPYDIPCSAGVETCKHIETVNLDLSTMLWINVARLSKTQRAKLENPGHMFSDEDLTKYREDSVAEFTRTVVINGDRFVLRVPSIREYIDSGRQWIETLTAKAKELFSNQENTDNAMRAYIDRLISYASLREYAAWFQSITINDVNEISGTDDIATALEALSKDANLTQELLAHVQEFIEDATIAVIAIPNFACPVCEKDHVTDEFSKHPELVAVDMTKLFFEYKDRKLLRAIQSTQA